MSSVRIVNFFKKLSFYCGNRGRCQMNKKRYTENWHKIVSVLFYLVFVLALLVPLGFTDPDLMLIDYPAKPKQEFFVFNVWFYFQPFMEFIFISMACVLLGLLIFGAMKVKTRAVIWLVILACIYVPFSFYLYLLPYFFDFLSDSLQVGIRKIICERHHTGIVATNVKYLYDCPLGAYTVIFVVIKNFFVLLNLTVLSAASGFIFMYMARTFQDAADYINYNRYLYFCLPIFVGFLPMVMIMSLGHLFELHAYLIYQVLIMAALTLSFLPIIIHTCNEVNPYGVVEFKIRKIYTLIGAFFLTLVSAGMIVLSVVVFEYDTLYLFMLHGTMEYKLLFASFYLFFVIMLLLMASSFRDDGFSFTDMSLVVFTACVMGCVLVGTLSDALAKVHYVWQVNDKLISRNVYDACVKKDDRCPYTLLLDTLE